SGLGAHVDAANLLKRVYRVVGEGADSPRGVRVEGLCELDYDKWRPLLIKPPLRLCLSAKDFS
ncbi:MAG: hypothetical protein ABWU84_11630, partial [Pyrobaculum sp.]|uniref:hypothetical protein n=1 Tax=Pyrobaculum sp. TaxID=2004705 RepID=UPI003EE9FEF5